MTSAAVHVVDNDAGFLDIAGHWLRLTGLAVATWLSPQAFLDGYDPDQPGCLVSAARMRECSGIELVGLLACRPCPLPVVMVATDPDLALAVRAMRQGAVDFLSKPLARAALIESVRRALSQDSARRARSARHADLEARYATLTAREQQVFDRLAANASAKRIALELRLSPRTVEHHREHLMAKLQARSWHDLVVMAILLGRYEPTLPPPA